MLNKLIFFKIPFSFIFTGIILKMIGKMDIVDPIGYFCQTIIYVGALFCLFFFASNQFYKNKFLSIIKLYSVCTSTLIIAYFFLLENFYIDKTNEFVNLSKSYNQECLIENIKDEVACDLYRYSLYNYKDIREEYLKYKAGNVDLFEKIYIVVVSFGALSWFIGLYMISLVLEVLYKNIAVYLSKKRFKC